VSGAIEKRVEMKIRQFKPYPEYADSGVEWIGSIPTHWGTEPLFTVARERKQRNAGNRVENVLSLSYGKIVQRDVATNLGLLPESFDTYQLVEPGNIVLRLTDLQNDKRSLRVGLVEEIGIITSAYLGLDLHRRLTPSYGFYLLHAYDVIKVFYALGAGVRQTMKFDDLKWMPILLPKADEQLAIAAFLNRETANIDALLTKNEQLIELLQEKRTALITRAVGKGLDPNVPVKDSGVEWLGEIPAQWEVVRLGRLAAIGNGSTPRRENAGYWLDGQHAWLTSSKINEENIAVADEFVTDLALRECHLPIVPAGSVLVAITGEGQTRGRAALLQIRATISQHLAFVYPRDPRLDSTFLWRAFQSQYEWLRMESSGGGSTRAALTCDYLRSVRIAVPPLSEQIEVVKFIAAGEATVLALIRKITEGIDCLNELRTALIFAAVTGKIDVRHEVPDVDLDRPHTG